MTMSKIAIATLQTVWDCRFSRPGFRLSGIAETLQPENRWVCTRNGRRRSVTDEECEKCPYWEMEDTGQI
jgi:hypothetical protein